MLKTYSNTKKYLRKEVKKVKKVILFVAIALLIAVTIHVSTFAAVHDDVGIVAYVRDVEGDYYVDIYNQTSNAWVINLPMEDISDPVNVGSTLKYSDGYGGWVVWNVSGLTLTSVWETIILHYENADLNQAYLDGIKQGHTNGYNQAKSQWAYNDNGTYYTGLEAYNQGLTNGSNTVNSLDWLKATLFTVGSLFTLQMLPGVTIGGVALLVIAVKMIPWLIGLMKGGKND